MTSGINSAVTTGDPTTVHAGKKIITDFWAEPGPLRIFDWCAVYDNYEPLDPVGYGRTEGDAVADLISQTADDDDDAV